MPQDPVVSRPAAPSSTHARIDGEWVWRNNGYVYKTGYRIPYDQHHSWVRGYWHQRQDGYWDWI
jgi:hypothetical protein